MQTCSVVQPASSIGLLEDPVGEFYGPLFASLRRRAQRATAVRYVHGLLTVQGRKTMRSLAEQYGGDAEQQRMQHFISNSPWDWMPVRQALRCHLQQSLEPQAWVVRQMIVPKAGNHSVGVGQAFVRMLGQTVNSQQAFGAWVASETVSSPMNWRLQLPDAWVTDTDRRRRAGVPEQQAETFPGEAACRSVLDLVDGRRDAVPLPAVLSVGTLDPVDCVREFGAAGVPVMMQVGPGLQLVGTDVRLQSPAGELVSAGRLADSAGILRRQVCWLDAQLRLRRTCTAAVRVALPTPQGRVPMVLLAEWDKPGPKPDRFWLTDVVGRSTAELLRLSKLVLRVDHDFEAIAKDVGIQDFEGRSFQGWHRHATLASIAHTVRALADSGQMREGLDETALLRVS
ncbi:transposase [Kribbella sp. NPDC051718]|uniref:IS701 family transposase n=1 Tax=Kribbella sp. NPDC051718 TaxID=3155168 RepID=UPI00343364E1